MIEQINLDDVHLFLNRQLDEGAGFAQLKCHAIKSRRDYSWSKGKLNNSFQSSKQVWVLRSFYLGTWGTYVANSFDELKESASLATNLAKEINQSRSKNSGVKDIMVSKPIRQLRDRSDSLFQLPGAQEILLLLKEIEAISPHNINLDFSDNLVDFYYWDSEHTRGLKQYYNSSLTCRVKQDQNQNYPLNLSLYATSNCEQPFSFKNLNWKNEVNHFRSTLDYDQHKGSSPKEMKWIFSSRAFAQLIYATLGPTICLERPDPFIEQMNPANLDDTQICSENFSMYSNPSLFSEKSFLDEEGVPVRKIPLIEKGVLKQLLMTRLSAFHLSRSLSVHKEKILAGSSRSSIADNAIKPDLQYVEVSSGEEILEYMKDAHVWIGDIKVQKVHTHGLTFRITAYNNVIVKYGGLHKRYLRKLSFLTTRNELWSKLITVGNERDTVHLKQAKHFYSKEAYSTFLVPPAVFEGVSCSWN